MDLRGKDFDQLRRTLGLIRGELTAYLHGSASAFDVIVSADTLVYFGSLDEVVAAAANALRPGGRFIFTVEDAAPPVPDGAGDALAPSSLTVADYLLSPHGRYNHSRQYLERVLTDAGLRPEIVGADLRLEAGSPVPGLVVRATNPPG